MKKVLLPLFIVISLGAQNLKMTVQEVLYTNPIILERLKNYNATKEDITNAKADYYPKLDLSIGVGIENIEKDNPSPTSGTTKTEENVYENSLKYSHNLFKGFQTTYRVAQEESKTTSSAYSYIEKVNDTTFEMVNTYLQVMRNRELLDTAKANVEINKEIFEKVNKLYDAGLTTLSEVNKIESSLSLARSNYVVQENTLLDVTYNMQRVLGRFIDPQNMSKPIINVALPANIEEATLFAIKNNPSLLVSKYNIKLAQASHKEKKSPFYPSVDLEISQDFNQNLSGIEGDYNRFKAMAYVKYNIFNGFSDSSALQKSISKVHQEVESKNSLRRQVIEGISLSWAANEKLGVQIEHLKEYKKFSLKTLTLYAKEYDLGRRSLLDLLSAQNDFIGAKSQIINTEYSMLFAKYRILDAMGILVPSIVDNIDIIYAKVGLQGETPINSDTLPISYDRDKDLITNEEDICNNSLSNEMRNLYGCKHLYEDTLRIERYSGFIFDNSSDKISQYTKQRLQDLISQLNPYGLKNIKIDLLGNAQDEELTQEKLFDLSNARAERIKQFLINAGIDEKSILTHAKGDIAPLFSSDTSEAILQNNRVDIIVRKLHREGN